MQTSTPEARTTLIPGRAYIACTSALGSFHSHADRIMCTVGYSGPEVEIPDLQISETPPSMCLANVDGLIALGHSVTRSSSDRDVFEDAVKVGNFIQTVQFPSKNPDLISRVSCVGV